MSRQEEEVVYWAIYPEESSSGSIAPKVLLVILLVLTLGCSFTVLIDCMAK